MRDSTVKTTSFHSAAHILLSSHHWWWKRLWFCVKGRPSNGRLADTPLCCKRRRMPKFGQFYLTRHLSTYHPLLRLTEKITSGFQRGRSTGAVFLDIQKAFDRVWWKRERKSILSDVAKRKVLKDIKIDPKLSAVKLAAETSRIMGRSVSAETVRNVIRHAGYSSRVAREKPFISLQNQKKRLEYAKTHQLKTDNFWKKVLFSDESKFNIFKVMAVTPFGENRTPLWIQKIYVLQLNMVVAPSWFGVVWLQMR
ncbi:HTH_Tnp_Tc3_2 domain-containing protein [Trichonephila clavipes]|nr:HTH_Tnp_Tc3_2 domain-containing protein [Trichonephila clavipes]